VATVLGSPNIVTTDTERRETWVYDKISSEVAYSESEGTVIGLIFVIQAKRFTGYDATVSWEEILTLIVDNKCAVVDEKLGNESEKN